MSQSSGQSQKNLELVTTILVIGTVSAIIFHYTRFAFIGNHAPFDDSFLHFPIHIFCDFYSLFDGYVRLSYHVEMNYLPGIFIPLQLLSYATSNVPYTAIQYVLAFYLMGYVPYVFYSLRGMEIAQRALAIFALVACNYAVLLTFHTGNFEFLCFLLVAYGIYYTIQRKPIIASILIGIAAAIKIYPAIFLFAILAKNNWKRLFIGSSSGFIITLIVGLAIRDGALVDNYLTWLNAAQTGLSNYSNKMILSKDGIAFGHSLLNAMKAIEYNTHTNIYLPYVYVFGLIGIIGTIALALKTNKIFLRLLALTSAICIFSPTSQDYKLLYFIIPLLLLIKSKSHIPHRRTLIVLVSCLLIPKDYFYFHDNIYINTNIFLNAIILVSILRLCILSVRTITHVEARNSKIIELCSGNGAG